jgi:lactose/L-arabinose transport system substrate-binding protein
VFAEFFAAPLTVVVRILQLLFRLWFHTWCCDGGYFMNAFRLIAPAVLALGGISVIVGAVAQQNAPRTDPVNGNSDIKGEITLRTWTKEQYLPVLSKFNAIYPNIKINIKDVVYENAYSQAGQAIAANDVDVWMIESSRVERFVTEFPEAFLDLSDWAKRYKSSFDKSKWAANLVNGNVYALPTDAAPVGFWYRADMFSKAAVNPEEIRTWDQYINAGRKVMDANSGVKMAPLFLTSNIAMMIQQQGGYYFDGSGQITISDAKSKQALRMLKRMNDAGLLLNTNTVNELIFSMKANRVASVLLPVYMISFIKRFMPEHAKLWGVQQIPAFAEGGGRSASIGGSTLMISKNSKNTEAAWAFAEWYTTEGANEWFDQVGTWPSYLPAIREVVQTKRDPFFATPDVYAPFRTTANRMRPLRYTSDIDKGIAAVSKAQDQVLKENVKVPDALEEAASELAKTTGREIARE